MVGSGLIGSGMVAWSPGIGVDQRPSLLPWSWPGSGPGSGLGLLLDEAAEAVEQHGEAALELPCGVAVAQGLAQLDQPWMALGRQFGEVGRVHGATVGD